MPWPVDTLAARPSGLPRGALSLRHKLLLIVLTTSLAALAVTGAAMVIYDLRAYHHSWVNDLMTQADILGRASAPALAFDDPRAAEENLALLKARPQISAAAIYTARGEPFASYAMGSPSNPQFPGVPETDGYQIEGKQLVVYKRIVENNETLGAIYLSAGYELFERLRDYVGILSVVMILSLVVAVLLSYWMHSEVTKPILAISDLMRKVMATRDFTLRAKKTTKDEIGYLADGFNGMLAEIGRRAQVMEESNRTLAREMNERRGVEDALRASERRNRTLVTATTSVVWTADGKGRFAEDQRSWSDYTGQQPHEYRGVGWREAFAAYDRAVLERAWAKAESAPDVFELELKLWHARSGGYRFVCLRAVPILGAQGYAQEWIGTVSDIDNQRRTEEELHVLNLELERRVTNRTAELEAANKELEAFSYSVSHDLRAPVRAVFGFSKLLWEDHAHQMDEEAKRKLAVIESEARRMGVLIDDLLAFSRLGRQAIQPVDLDMETLVKSTFARILSQHQGPPPEFHVGPLPRAAADRALLEQVWVNLLSNALKFSAKREKPVIEVGASSDEREHTYFVRDNGAGFDPRYLSKLFGVFQRLHDASEFAGTGVGLALVSRIVNRHGGRVWAEGQPDQGATFYFTLPKEPLGGTR